jgi:hypothetical protein
MFQRRVHSSAPLLKPVFNPLYWPRHLVLRFVFPLGLLFFSSLVGTKDNPASNGTVQTRVQTCTTP